MDLKSTYSKDLSYASDLRSEIHQFRSQLPIQALDQRPGHTSKQVFTKVSLKPGGYRRRITYAE